ncbi:DUF4124 domain-containing protein [Massilia sp. MS-15]|uniref:DUF4124 domain-containing protein n=1 Tax=Massilia sp. MS-15 TaxID=2878200 RepID=UPI001CD39B06|nr:DUF4124 domain-containing protein [Massilia sp. MS-15]MCA1248205.1 DUF4124 domain-containing protein [Massilia sp. MS-15]
MQTPFPFRHLTLLCALLLGAGGAQAQYSWIDAKGTRHFSDQPPPPSTPPQRILKMPARHAPGPAPAPASTPVDARPAPTLAEREADYVQRARQREAQEKKLAEDAARQRALLENCERAREVRAQAESGIRIAKVDANGERRFVTDQERAEELARARRMLAQCP